MPVIDSHSIYNELLSKINYPGFNRDIVSFGMVDDIQIESKNIIIYF